MDCVLVETYAGCLVFVLLLTADSLRGMVIVKMALAVFEGVVVLPGGGETG